VCLWVELETADEGIVTMGTIATGIGLIYNTTANTLVLVVGGD